MIRRDIRDTKQVHGDLSEPNPHACVWLSSSASEALKAELCNRTRIVDSIRAAHKCSDVEVEMDGNRVVGFSLTYLNANLTFKVALRVRLKVSGEGKAQRVATAISGYSTQVEITTSGSVYEFGPQATVPNAVYSWVKDLTKLDGGGDTCPWLDIDGDWATNEATRKLVGNVWRMIGYFNSDIRINAKKKPRARRPASSQPTGTTNYRTYNPYVPMGRRR
jgi:hypothetical protein